MKKRLHIMIAKILCVLFFRFLMDFVSDQLWQIGYNFLSDGSFYAIFGYIVRDT